MVANEKNRIVFILCLLTTFIPVLSQSPPSGLSGETWTRMSDRREHYLSWAVVDMKNGSRLEGQVLYVTDRDLWLRPDRSIPLLPAGAIRAAKCPSDIELCPLYLPAHKIGFRSVQVTFGIAAHFGR